MAKLPLPKTKFSHELVTAPTDPTMKSAEATSAKLWNVPVDKIMPIPGFNVRVESPDYEAHRQAIKESILANGYDTTKPLAGYVAKEGDENVIYVTDGHTRLAAVQEINDEADKDGRIAKLPVLVQPKEVSLTDLTVQLHTANSGRPLTPFELGVVTKRLLAEDGAKKSDIAKRLGVTTRYLDDVLLLASADKAVKQHVAAGTVSSTMAIGLLKKDPEAAAEKIEAAIKKAGSGKKVTAKHAGPKTVKIKHTIEVADGQDMKAIVKHAAAAIREAVPAVDGEDAETLVADVAGTITLVIEVPAPATEKPTAKDKEPAAKKAKAPAAKKAKPKKEEPEAAKPKKEKKPKVSESDAGGIDGAEPLGEDDEVAQLPPKVSSDENVNEEVDI